MANLTRAQEIEIDTPPDSNRLELTDSTYLESFVSKSADHSPGGAAWRSAVAPGWGQIYNKKYWKLPLVYGALGGATFAIIFNAKRHRRFRNAIICQNHGILSESVCQDIFGLEYSRTLSEDELFTLKDFYRRNIDVSIIGFTLAYVMTLIDAVVDAHLFEFDISDDLSMKVLPDLYPSSFGQAFGPNPVTIGLRMNIKLK